MEKIVYNVIFRSNILVRLVVPTVNIGATKSHQSHLCLRPCLYSSVCVRPVRKSHCLFFHEGAQILTIEYGSERRKTCLKSEKSDPLTKMQPIHAFDLGKLDPINDRTVPKSA